MNSRHINQHTGSGHGSFRSYVAGLVMSVLLTLAAFGVVMAGGDGIGRTAILTVAAICAALQILVQLVCFMHMGSSGQWWNRMSFLLTVLTLAILVVGSLWVMHHLHINMHPDNMGDGVIQSICAPAETDTP